MKSHPPVDQLLTAARSRSPDERALALAGLAELLNEPQDLSSDERRETARALVSLVPAGEPSALYLDLAGLTFIELEDFEAAREAFAQGLELSTARDGTYAQVLHNLASTEASLGDVANAEGRWREAARLFLELGDTAEASESLHFVLDALIRLGRSTEAEHLLTRSAALLRRRGGRGEATLLRVSFAELLFNQTEDPGEARRHLMGALRSARRDEEPGAEAVVLMSLADLHLAVDSPGQAIRWARKATRAADNAVDPTLQIATRRQLSYMLATAGRLDESKTALREAIAVEGADVEHLYAETEFASVAAFEDPSPDPIAHLSHLVSRLDGAIGRSESLWAHRNLIRALLVADRIGEASEQMEATITSLRPHELDEFVPQFLELLLARDAIGEARGFIDRARRRLGPTALGMAAAHLHEHHLDKDALALWRGAIEKSRSPREEFPLRNDYAITLADLGELDEAIGEMRICLDLARDIDDAKEIQALANLGETLRRAGKPDEAVDLLQHASGLTTDPGDAAWLRSLTALALSDTGQASKALEILQPDLENAARLSPELAANALSAAGAARYQLADFQAAAEAYSCAAELREAIDDPKLFESLHGLTVSLAQTGADAGEVGEPAYALLSALENKPNTDAAEWAALTSLATASEGLEEVSAAAFVYAVMRLSLIGEDAAAQVDVPLEPLVAALTACPSLKPWIHDYAEAWAPQMTEELDQLIDKVTGAASQAP